MENIFDKIKNDTYIIELYNNISLLEQDGTLWHSHGLMHINNVINTVEVILKQLNFSNEIIENAKIAALLHDIGCIEGKEDHAERSYEMAQQYFKKNNIDTGSNELILDAIKLHGGKEETDNFIAKVLVFADKIDIKYDRLTETGKNIDVVKEFQYIKDVVIDINEDTLTVNVIADDKINKETFDSYYFIPKIFNAVIEFAKELKLKSVILFNNESWIINR